LTTAIAIIAFFSKISSFSLKMRTRSPVLEDDDVAAGGDGGQEEREGQRPGGAGAEERH
jgi:hypothetical protein